MTSIFDELERAGCTLADHPASAHSARHMLLLSETHDGIIFIWCADCQLYWPVGDIIHHQHRALTLERMCALADSVAQRHLISDSYVPRLIDAYSVSAWRNWPKAVRCALREYLAAHGVYALDAADDCYYVYDQVWSVYCGLHATSKKEGDEHGCATMPSCAI